MDFICGLIVSLFISTSSVKGEEPQGYPDCKFDHRNVYVCKQ